MAKGSSLSCLKTIFVFKFSLNHHKARFKCEIVFETKEKPVPKPMPVPWGHPKLQVVFKHGPLAN